MKPLKQCLIVGSGIATLCLGFILWQFAGEQANGEVSFASVVAAKAATERDLILGQAKESKEDTSTEKNVVFNDPALAQKWDLKKTDAQRGWQISKGSRDIVVAVIDTGADINHEDLKANIWKNPKEIPNNGIDDDKNGFVDDVYGWNFVSNNNNLTDNHGHGTHIAGIIGAEGGNNKGISGIAPQVSMMILKYYDPKVPNTDNLKNTVAAIKYAVKMGANIINYSGGGTEFSQEEHDAIEEARKQGILFVAAAGNEKSNSDHHHYYPADYGLSNIISVTAFDPSTEVLASSNYGIETVQIAAPGQNILSTLPNNSYGYMTGTSQATAFVTGAAAVVMAHRQSFQADDVKKYILATGDQEPSLIAKTGTSRKLNLYKALTIFDQSTSLTGIVAANTADIKISSDASVDENTNALNNVSQFGHSLSEAMQKIEMKKN